MLKPDIAGLKRYDQLSKVPDLIARGGRRTKYDRIISDAKRRPVRLTFADENKATNVYVALRARMRRDRETLQVRKKGIEVYVFALKISGIRPGGFSARIPIGKRTTKR